MLDTFGCLIKCHTYLGNCIYWKTDYLQCRSALRKLSMATGCCIIYTKSAMPKTTGTHTHNVGSLCHYGMFLMGFVWLIEWSPYSNGHFVRGLYDS